MQEDHTIHDVTSAFMGDDRLESQSDDPMEDINSAGGPVKAIDEANVKLEDLLFQTDDEDDEEFPSSSATPPKVDSSPPAKSMYYTQPMRLSRQS